MSSKKEKESLPIVGGPEEHLQVWFLCRFLFYSPHHPIPCSSLAVSGYSFVDFGHE